MGEKDRLIVALDAEPDEAITLAQLLQGEVSWLKVGMTLFYKAGPAVVSRLTDMGFRVFLDLKLHDIPHQVEGAARTIAGLGAGMMTVHSFGGSRMIQAAVRGAAEGAAESGVLKPAVLAVTVLTSLGQADLAEVGVLRAAEEQVSRLAGVAADAGADGVVCSPLEAASVRALLGPVPHIVTPGVRPAGSAAGDQSRTATPTEAVSSGASHIVVGRPITAAHKPVDAARRIIAEMEAQ